MFKTASTYLAAHPKINNLIQDLIKEDDKVKPLINEFVNNKISNAFLEAINKTHYNRGIIKHHILQQNNYSEHKACLDNIALIEKENTYFVSTAHQPCILLGPLYTIYKALSTIKWAETINKNNPNAHCIPLFVVGSEDHDWEEINNVVLNKKKYHINKTLTGKIGSQRIESDIQKVIEDIAFDIKDKPFSDEVIITLKNHLKSGATYSKSFTSLLLALLGKYGLLCIDLDNIDFKKQALSLALGEILENKALKNVQQQNQFLENNQYKVQAFVREINLFETQKNERKLIIKNNEQTTFIKSSLNKNEALEYITQNIQNISYNVILRPLFQCLNIPTLLFVGGGGELGYWLQLKTLFESHNVFYPMLSLRNSITLLDKNTIDKILKINPDVWSWEKNLEEIIKENINIDTDWIEKMKNAWKDEWENNCNKILHNDTNSLQASKAAWVNIEKSIQQWQQKYVTMQKKQESQNIDRITKLKEKIFPNNQWQERSEGFWYWAACYGLKIIDTIYNQIETESKHKIIVLEN